VIGYDVAALSLSPPYQHPHFRTLAPDSAELNTCAGTFQLGSDFYQPNAKVGLIAIGQELAPRWPSGDGSALVPLDRDHFTDRSYWEKAELNATHPENRVPSFMITLTKGAASGPSDLSSGRLVRGGSFDARHARLEV
jgi:hypothetical protein